MRFVHNIKDWYHDHLSALYAKQETWPKDLADFRPPMTFHRYDICDAKSLVQMQGKSQNRRFVLPLPFFNFVSLFLYFSISPFSLYLYFCISLRLSASLSLSLSLSLSFNLFVSLFLCLSLPLSLSFSFSIFLYLSLSLCLSVSLSLCLSLLYLPFPPSFFANLATPIRSFFISFSSPSFFLLSDCLHCLSQMVLCLDFSAQMHRQILHSMVQGMAEADFFDCAASHSWQ